MPAYNEAQVVGSVIGETLACIPDCEIVVVDDGSRDETAAVARDAGATVLQLPYNLGVGGAIRAGFLFARERDVDIVVQVDGDGQHDPQEITRLVESLGTRDLVVGSRFLGIGTYGVGGARRLAMRALAWGTSLMCRTPLTDVTSGFRVVGPRGINLFATDLPAEYLGDTVEALVLAHRSGLTIGEIGVAMHPRRTGQPSQGLVKSSLYAARAFVVLLLSGVRKMPPPIPPRPTTS